MISQFSREKSIIYTSLSLIIFRWYKSDSWSPTLAGFLFLCWVGEVSDYHSQQSICWRIFHSWWNVARQITSLRLPDQPPDINVVGKRAHSSACSPATRCCVVARSAISISVSQVMVGQPSSQFTHHHCCGWAHSQSCWLTTSNKKHHQSSGLWHFSLSVAGPRPHHQRGWKLLDCLCEDVPTKMLWLLLLHRKIFSVFTAWVDRCSFFTTRWWIINKARRVKTPR